MTSCELFFPEENEILFPKEAFEPLYNSESNNFWFQVRNMIIGYEFKKHIPLNSKILEVGCGTGFVSKHIKSLGYNIDCSDAYETALDYCKLRDAGNNYYKFDLSKPLPKNKYDCVCIFDVLEHLDDDILVLSNIKEALKDNGFVFITVPANKNLWSENDVYAGHKRRYDLKELNDKVTLTFKIINIGYFMAFLFPFIFVSRLRKSSLKDELDLNPIVNKTFYCIFKLESCFLRYFNMPFGSSILCIAQKK